MAVQFYDLKPEEITTLKDAFYEVESYRTIMGELVREQTDDLYTYPIFEDFRKHYKEALIAYDKAKIEFEFDFVKMKHHDATHWNVTFGDNKVEIRYPG
jgi:hypothetical protein